MNIPEDAVAILRTQLKGTPTGVAFEYMLAQDHEARVQAVQKAVDFACNELEQNKHKKQGYGEDALTLEVCSVLRALGFQAVHDDNVGGHCDIVIRGDESFLWLAEAKKHNDYAWLDKGFRQLATRYSTGVAGQDNGEVLIYCFSKNAAAMLKTWRQELEARNAGVKTTDTACGNPLLFCSTHEHEATGLDFHVRHKAVALYWNPKDS